MCEIIENFEKSRLGSVCESENVITGFFWVFTKFRLYRRSLSSTQLERKDWVLGSILVRSDKLT
jgi:hypothetical protein